MRRRFVATLDYFSLRNAIFYNTCIFCICLCRRAESLRQCNIRGCVWLQLTEFAVCFHPVYCLSCRRSFNHLRQRFLFSFCSVSRAFPISLYPALLCDTRKGCFPLQRDIFLCYSSRLAE